VRGKLRDKRADARRDRLKRELKEMRRPGRRENRNVALLSQQYEEDEDWLEEEELDEDHNNKQ